MNRFPGSVQAFSDEQRGLTAKETGRIWSKGRFEAVHHSLSQWQSQLVPPEQRRAAFLCDQCCINFVELQCKHLCVPATHGHQLLVGTPFARRGLIAVRQ